ncbi:uncharacterized protein LOC143616478 [Bidens hawaiensis]|uniref:uncharacterized protein LOC143616478 n=1 Tax=Bidens hawaiensis TaxID=980011 RepID=UPI004049FBB4
MKLDSLMKDLKDRDLFGKLQAETKIAPCTYMPFLHSDHKIYNPENIEKFISAKIPDKNEDLESYSLNETPSDYNGFPIYRRRDLGNVVVKSAVNLDNRHVVPYNKKLLKKYQAHINVEWCNQEGSIKYLFKYINKGLDRATISLVQEKTDNQDEEVDEAKAFYNCRYLSAYDDDAEDVLNKPIYGSSRFTAWMECNEKYSLSRTLTYIELPKKFVSKQDERHWDLHKRGFSIGRVHHVPPAFNEAYYLRILLNTVRDPTFFEDIRTVDGEVCATYRDACYKRDLLDDDNEYIEAIEEASHTASDLVLLEAKLKNLALLEIQNFLLRNNYTLRYFPTMPFPDEDSIFESTNRFMNEELAYDTQVMTDEFQRLFTSLTAEQRDVHQIWKRPVDFAEWLLELGEGKLGGDNDGNAIIDIPDDLLISDSSDYY